MEIETYNEQIVISNAIKKIKQEQTLLKYLLDINYYIINFIINLTLALLNVHLKLIVKTIKVKSVILFHNKKQYKSDKIYDLIF